MPDSYGILGLGNLGGGVAKCLLGKGASLTGWDPLPEKLSAFTAAGGKPGNGATGVIQAVDVVLLSLPSAAALDSVVADVLAVGKPGLVVVETSTLPLAIKEAARDRLAARGIHMLDCTVSGAARQAETGTLAMQMSGDAALCERIRQLVAGFTSSATYVGKFGMAIRLKLIINMMGAVMIELTSEAFLLAEKAGVDAGTFVDVINKSAVGSRMFEIRSHAMKAREYDDPGEMTAGLGIGVKDNHVIRDFAESLGAPLPLFNTAFTYFEAAMARGWAGRDISCISEVLRGMAGAR